MLPRQNFALDYPSAGGQVGQHLLQGILEGGGLRRHGDYRAAVRRDILVDSEDVHPCARQHVECAGQDARLVLQHHLKGDDGGRGAYR